METTPSPAPGFEAAYPLAVRLRYALVLVIIAILVAGFWHRGIVDGFGRDVVAGSTIGNTSELATEYDDKGSGFGFVFAVVAGLAATFTACNCVVFAMLPGLACSTDANTSRTTPLQALALFTLPVLAITAVYGLYVGFLGPVGIDYINKIEVRHAQSFAVFSALGIAMLIWGLFELGFLDAIKARVSQTTREFFAQLSVKAVLLGSMVGMFTVGRPYPLFRDFLVYAASNESPLYGAVVMMIQGLGQIVIMAILFILLVRLGGRRLATVAEQKPHRFRLISGMALLGGGIYFLFYWGLGRALEFGRWGYKLGWYA